MRGAGIIHRDIKAGNVVREDGGLIVLMEEETNVEEGLEGPGGARCPGLGRGAGGKALVARECLASSLDARQREPYLPLAAGGGVEPLPRARGGGAPQQITHFTEGRSWATASGGRAPMRPGCRCRRRPGPAP